MRTHSRFLGRLIRDMGILFAGLSVVGLVVVGATLFLPGRFVPPSLTLWMDDLLAGWLRPYAAFEPDEFVYDYTLGTDVPRVYYLSIPKVSLHAPVVTVADRSVQVGGQSASQLYVPNAFAVGWRSASAPVGARGNTVFVGHNNVYGEVFKDLWHLQAGDAIIVQTASGDRTYTVSQTVTFEEGGRPLEERFSNAIWMEPTSHEQLTLITCWPYHTNSHRLVVVALPTN